MLIDHMIRKRVDLDRNLNKTWGMLVHRLFKQNNKLDHHHQQIIEYKDLIVNKKLYILHGGDE